jgi:hypothetical protein
MAFVLSEPFEDITTATLITETGSWTRSINGGNIISAASGVPTPYTGSNCVQVVSSNQLNLLNHRGSFAGGEVLFRFYASNGANSINVGDGSIGLFKVGMVSGPFHMSLRFDATRALVLREGDIAGTIKQTSSNVLAPGIERWVECRAKWLIHDSTGYMEVFIDGSSTGWINYTGDTRNGGTADWVYLQFFGVGGSETYLDDVILYDSDTSDAGNPAVECLQFPQPRVASILASTGNGTNTGSWTRSTGSDDGALVDESTPNGDTDYLTSSTPGHKVTVNLPSITAGQEVIGAALHLQMRRTAGAPTAKGIFRSGGTDYLGASFAPHSAYGGNNLGTVSCLGHSLDPATGLAWTVAGINALEVGAEYTTGSDPLRLSRVRVTIAYVVLDPPTASDDTYTTPYETPLAVNALLGVLANDTQNSGTGFIAVLDVDVDHGDLVLNSDGSFEFAPEAGYVGDAVFTYHAETSEGESSIATVTIEITDIDPPEGGGELPVGVPPGPAQVPTDFPLIFTTFMIDGVEYVFSEDGLQLNDDADWYYGKKLPYIINISPLNYTLDMDIETVTWTVDIWDGERVFQDLMGDGATRARGGFNAVYVVSDAVRRAKGTPLRLGNGKISKYKAKDNILTFTVRDIVGWSLSKQNEIPIIPPNKLTIAEFAGLAPELDNAAMPIALGRLSDQDDAVPQGVVPGLYMGYFNLSSIGGADVEVDIWLWSQGAMVTNGVWDVYYNSETDPLIRLRVPGTSFGTDVLTPYKPFWLTYSGQPGQYVDHMGRRYTPMFVRRDMPLALAAREGRVLIAANIYGLAENEDGTGLYLDSGPRIIQWILDNLLYGRWSGTAMIADPLFPELYNFINTDTIEAVHAYLWGRLDYPIGMLLGAGGEFNALFDVLTKIVTGIWIRHGIDMDGQYILGVWNPDADPICEFDATLHIEEMSYEWEVDETRNFNRVEHQFGKYYVPPYAPAPTPPEGEPVPTIPIPEYPPYKYTATPVEDTGAQLDVGEILTYTLENEVVRNPAVAADVSERILEESLGPQGDGPHVFTLAGSWPLLGTEAVPVRLGSTFLVRHPNKAGADALDKCWATKLSIDPMNHRVTWGGDIYTHDADPL